MDQLLKNPKFLKIHLFLMNLMFLKIRFLLKYQMNHFHLKYLKSLKCHLLLKYLRNH